MKNLDGIKYEKINFKKLEERINELFKNQELIELGLQKKILAKTEYGYDIPCISIGNGENELFVVAGTHGSEVITVDFVTQLLEKINTFEEFDPNIFKINVIPVQNPEGFDISSSVFNNIENEKFNNSSYEYYLRYRTDSIVANVFKDLNLFMNNLINEAKFIDANEFLTSFKIFIFNNNNFKKLEDKRTMPNIIIFNNLLNSITKVNDFNELRINLCAICDRTISKLDINNINDIFLRTFIVQLKNAFLSDKLWNDIKNDNQIKLYQQMFKNSEISNLQIAQLESDIKNMYKLYKHPLGSQIGHDSTGIGINLNANNKLNPGIQANKNGTIIWGLGVKNNIKNYFPGPIGTSCRDIYNFDYAIENKALYNLINESYQNGNYLATLLYHGTGGLIYYKPYHNEMNELQYAEFYNYNKELANIYHDSTDYKILEDASTTGYGDLLRRTFPGVLLIELSKMGGNPIAPYGDYNNIYNTMNDNFKAFDSLLNYFSQNIKKNSNNYQIKKLSIN